MKPFNRSAKNLTSQLHFNMTEVKNIPRLRFPEFHGEWIESLLGDIAKFSKGKGISKSDIFDNGEYECIRYGELYTHYNEVIDKVISKTDFNNNPVLSEINDVIIPASGETALDIATASCVLKSGVLLGGDLNIIRSKVNGVFLSYYLNNKRKKEIARLSQGNSVVHVYPSQLKTLKIFIPQTTEYDEIAEFLTVVDKRIELLEKKKTLLKTYKKGVMKKIFNQEIRFKDDNGNDFPDWEEKRLEDVLNYEQPTKYLVDSTDYSDSYDLPVLTAGKSFILGYTNETTGVYSNLPTIIFDDFTTSFHYVDFEFKMKSSAMKMLTVKSNNYNLKLVFEIMKNLRFVLSEHKRYWISEYSQMFISIPSIEEQTKISNFSNQLDTQIELLETQIDKSKTWKKGLLQKMFV